MRNHFNTSEHLSTLGIRKKLFESKLRNKSLDYSPKIWKTLCWSIFCWRLNNIEQFYNFPPLAHTSTELHVQLSNTGCWAEILPRKYYATAGHCMCLRLPWQKNLAKNIILHKKESQEDDTTRETFYNEKYLWIHKY